MIQVLSSFIFTLHLAVIFSISSQTTFHASVVGATAPAPAPGASGNDTDFIRRSCDSTRYPDICFSSLSGYAGSVQQSPRQLARVAISVSVSKAQATYCYIGNLSIRAAAIADPLAKMALGDCSRTFKEAISLIVQSQDELSYLYISNFPWRLSNILTWMSAALTNEQTCIDGFENVTSVSGSVLKAVITEQVSVVSQITSNALAVVNGLLPDTRR